MPIAVPAHTGLQGSPSSLERRRDEYAVHLEETLALQAELQEDVDDLIAQEGFDVGVQRGLREWAGDKGAVWRALRRHKYDHAKVHAALLSTFSYRIAHNLHLQIPPCPCTSRSDTSTTGHAASSIAEAAQQAHGGGGSGDQVPPFAILPLPTFTHPSGQPIALITARQILRDDQGSLDGLKEWVVWGMEMTRRAVREHYASGIDDNGDAGHGAWKVEDDGDGQMGDEEWQWGMNGDVQQKAYAGEGCVLVIDAAGAGYRNLEVELLPTLLSLAQSHYPSLFTSVFIINSGWAQRSMWAVVKRLLPKSAGDKVRFLDDRKAVHEEFEGRLLQISQRADTGADGDSEEVEVVKGFIAGFHPGRRRDLALQALTDAEECVSSCAGGGSNMGQQDLGGDIDFTLTYATDQIQQYHSTRASYQSPRPPQRQRQTISSSDLSRQNVPVDTLQPPTSISEDVSNSRAVSRTASCSSMADLFHTARTSPVASAHASRRGSIGIASSELQASAPAFTSGPSAMSTTGMAGMVSPMGMERPASGATLARHLRRLQMTQAQAQRQAQAHQVMYTGSGMDSKDGEAEDEDEHVQQDTGVGVEAGAQSTLALHHGSALVARSSDASLNKAAAGIISGEMVQVQRRQPYASVRSARTVPHIQHHHSAYDNALGQKSPVLAPSSFAPPARHEGKGQLLTGGANDNDIVKSRNRGLPRITTTRLPEVRSTAQEEGTSKGKGKGKGKSAHSTPNLSPIQRIKSLSDFHLYLSPSRLAHIDLLSDSDSSDGDDHQDRGMQCAHGVGRGEGGDAACEVGPSHGAGGGVSGVATSARHGPRTSAAATPRSFSQRDSSRASTLPALDGQIPVDVDSRSLAVRPILGRAPPTRRTLHPLIFDPEETDRLHAVLSSTVGIAQRRGRARPALRIQGVKSAYDTVRRSGVDLDLEAEGDDDGEGRRRAGGIRRMDGTGDVTDGAREGEAGARTRTYSGAMGLHHVVKLRSYQQASGSPGRSRITATAASGREGAYQSGHPKYDAEQEEYAPPAIALGSTDTTPPALGHPAQHPAAVHAIPAYSRSLNPYYGYPALLLPAPSAVAAQPSSLDLNPDLDLQQQPPHNNGPIIVPRHPRRRNRDLIKTLLFLAMLRLQNVRDTIERKLGLRSLGGRPWVRLRERYLDFDYSFVRGGASERGLTATSSATARGARIAREERRGSGKDSGIVGPEEGLERVEQEQRRRLHALTHYNPAASWSGRTDTRTRLKAPRTGTSNMADVVLHSLGWLGWSSTYSAEWVWAVVGLILFRGAWVRVLQRLVGVMETLRSGLAGRGRW